MPDKECKIKIKDEILWVDYLEQTVSEELPMRS